jgi:hypothetical protein
LELCGRPSKRSEEGDLSFLNTLGGPEEVLEILLAEIEAAMI